jgi:hypothetical protein
MVDPTATQSSRLVRSLLCFSFAATHR